MQYGYTQNGKQTFVKNLQLQRDRSGARSHSFQIDVLKSKHVDVSIKSTQKFITMLPIVWINTNSFHAFHKAYINEKLVW